MPAENPWSWTLDDLVAETCHSGALYQAAGCAAEDIPDPAALEHRLRRRQFTGAMFLTVLDSPALVVRNEFEIPHLNQRLALMSVVELLRRRSHTCEQQVATAGVRSLNIKGANYLTVVRPTNLSSEASVVDETGRKRRKITDISTMPLPGMPQSIPGPTNSLVPTQSSGQSQAVGDGWDHLLERWGGADGDEEELDLAMEDDLEDEEHDGLEGETEEDAQDIQDDQDEPAVEASKRNKLSEDQIVEIINERIEFYTDSWFVNRGVLKGDEINYDPNTIWEEAEAKGLRQQYVKKYEAELEHYDERLDRLCEEIRKFPGINADKVRQQCRNLEGTIDSIELSKWLIGIYKLDPVENSDSDEEQELNDRGIDLPTHGPKLRTEIIDLGSPSGSSDVEDYNASPFDTTKNAITSSPPSRFPTSGPIVVDIVEPVVYTIPERLIQEHPPINHGDEPEHASITTVRRWRWTDVISNLDRKRVVSKAIHEMRFEEREVIRSRIRHVGKANLIKEVEACVTMFARGDSRMQGVLPRDLPKIIIFTNLFLSWWFCNNYFSQPTASREQLEELKNHIDDRTAETGTFYDYVRTILTTTFSEKALQHPERPSQAEIIEISDDDEPLTQPTAQWRKSTSNRGPVIVID
ncbi:hypothetical protein EJ02DRAFT_455593 [Clathrospora elynae]|uniref:DUF7607 domain-containing protein n=1 Tax=Clathrospora elynae TaxID=706981 RepID=A0A6A5SV07_9PLEO|nr:hypothetical protein EJ02DRAFT_455593 [Clathrospora elynae]